MSDFIAREPGVQIIVPISGGVSSGYIACRAQEECHKPICPFSDTKHEDRDTYRFLREIVARWALDYREASDGRGLLELFAAQHIIPARQIAACSVALKIRPAQAYLQSLSADRQYRVAYGYGPEEEDRVEKMLANWSYPAHIKPIFPLYEAGITKQECMGFFLQAGVALPRVYAYRNNANCKFCKNFRKKDWEALAYHDPEAFAEALAFASKAQEWPTPGRWMQDGPLLSELVIPAAKPDRKGRRKLAMAEPAFSFHSECGACAID